LVLTKKVNIAPTFIDFVLSKGCAHSGTEKSTCDDKLHFCISETTN